MLNDRLKLYLVILCALLQCYCFADAQTGESFPFLGQVQADNINVRADSTVSSAIICKVNKGDYVEVLSELYGWYKIRLPKHTPAYVKKELVELMDAQTARVVKDKVNIRLLPSESSPTIGKAAPGELVNILDFQKGWYKIEPAEISFGWINGKFVTRGISKTEKENLQVAEVQLQEKELKASEAPEDRERIVIEGILKPQGRIFRRQATHKLIDKDKKIFLLKGHTTVLDSLTHYKVKVMGKIISPAAPKYPLVEVDKIEVLD